ncbi:MAG: FAD-dependent oxidoreductase [Oscillospiraceae bacterium]
MAKMSTKMKVLIISAICVVIVLAIGGCERIFAGRARVHGYSGYIEMTAELLNDGKFKIKVDRQNEGYGIGDLAVSRIVDEINEDQNPDVDIIAGATESSAAAIECAKHALKSAGIDPDSLAQSKDDKENGEYIDYTCDVVVVGAGGAGLTAAISAAQNGANVILVEKMGLAGGTTVRSGGMVMAAGTEQQAYDGISDSTSSFAGFLYDHSGDSVQQNRLISLSEHSADNIKFLTDIGVSFSDTLLSTEDSPTPRIHLAVNAKGDASGGAIIKPLVEAAVAAGVRIIYNSEVYELTRDMVGEIMGVRAKQDDGDIITVWADATVLATGGYDRSSVFLQDFNKVPALPVYSYTSVGSTGEGIELARKAGAKILEGSLIAELYDFYANSNGSSGLLVTPDGARFVNEENSALAQGSAIQIAGYGTAYLITDSHGYKGSFKNGIKNETVVKADTLEQLAEILNAKQLVNTVKNYNQACAVGVDEEFGKSVESLKAIGRGPYYAVQYSLKSYGTMGGIRTNTGGQAMSEIGAVPGLFACGEAANGNCLSGSYPGNGASLAQVIDSGRLAGKSASEYSKSDHVQSIIVTEEKDAKDSKDKKDDKDKNR